MNKNLTEQDFIVSANALDIEVAMIKAVAKIEAPRGGFLKNGLPTILFEGHKFSRFTKGRYDKIEPTISYKKWTSKHYKGGAREYERFFVASALAYTSALLSTSWGKFQIMGFNYKQCNYDTVTAFVYDMQVSEGLQLLAFTAFIKGDKNMWGALREKNWAGFARRYNGSGYKKNKYDTKLARAYKKFKEKEQV